MSGARTFGKLGNRAMARMAAAIDGGLVLTGRSARCRVENVSRAGCRLRLDEPPLPGATVLVRIERVEALGTAVWVENGRCGVTFAKPLEPRELERLRWIVEHPGEHEKNIMASATAIWR